MGSLQRVIRRLLRSRTPAASRYRLRPATCWNLHVQTRIMRGIAAPSLPRADVTIRLCKFSDTPNRQGKPSNDCDRVCWAAYPHVEANVTFEDRTIVVTCIRSLPNNAINTVAKKRSITATCRPRTTPLHQRRWHVTDLTLILFGLKFTFHFLFHLHLLKFLFELLPLLQNAKLFP